MNNCERLEPTYFNPMRHLEQEINMADQFDLNATGKKCLPLEKEELIHQGKIKAVISGDGLILDGKNTKYRRGAYRNESGVGERDVKRGPFRGKGREKGGN